MLGMLLIDLYLLFAIVGGEYVTDHQSLLMEQNCSARLNISLQHPDLSRGDNHVECPPWFIPNNVWTSTAWLGTAGGNNSSNKCDAVLLHDPSVMSC